MKTLKVILYILFFILMLICPILFPLLGIYSIDNNITILIIICTIFSIYWIASMLSHGELIQFIIMYVITVFCVSQYEKWNPYHLALIELPLLDTFCKIPNLIIKIFKDCIYKIKEKYNIYPKKIIISILSLLILGTLIFLYIDNFNMNYDYYTNSNKNYLLRKANDELLYISFNAYNEEIEFVETQLESLRNRNIIIYTILLLLSTVDTILIITTKFDNINKINE